MFSIILMSKLLHLYFSTMKNSNGFSLPSLLSLFLSPAPLLSTSLFPFLFFILFLKSTHRTSRDKMKQLKLIKSFVVTSSATIKNQMVMAFGLILETSKSTSFMFSDGNLASPLAPNTVLHSFLSSDIRNE